MATFEKNDNSAAHIFEERHKYFAMILEKLEQVLEMQTVRKLLAIFTIWFEI